MKDNPNPELVKKTIVPDVALGSHTASMGLAFGDKSNFSGKYKNGVFVAQHGSWNHSKLVGYKVLFVPFSGGKPSGPPEDFITGFITGEENKVYGRPTAVAFTKDGSLLLTDDASNTIWRVSSGKK